MTIDPRSFGFFSARTLFFAAFTRAERHGGGILVWLNGCRLKCGNAVGLYREVITPRDRRKSTTNGYDFAQDISRQNYRLTEPCPPPPTEETGVNSGRAMLRLGSQLSQFFTGEPDLRRLLSALVEGFGSFGHPGQIWIEKVEHISTYRIDFALLDFAVCGSQKPR